MVCGESIKHVTSTYTNKLGYAQRHRFATNKQIYIIRNLHRDPSLLHPVFLPFECQMKQFIEAFTKYNVGFGPKVGWRAVGCENATATTWKLLDTHTRDHPHKIFFLQINAIRNLHACIFKCIENFPWVRWMLRCDARWWLWTMHQTCST